MAQAFEFIWRGDRIVAGKRKDVNTAMFALAQEIDHEIKKWIRHHYPPASKPGQRPRIRTGTFKDSILVQSRGQEIHVRSIDYGGYLEGGTSRMRPRPWLAPVLRGRENKRYWTSRLSQIVRGL